MLGADVVVDPDGAFARMCRVDRLADELAPEHAAVLALVLPLDRNRASVAHFVVPRRISVVLLLRAVDRPCALPDQLAGPIAEHLLEARIAALIGALPDEGDAYRRVVEDQLLFGKRTLHAQVRFALGRHVLEAPDPLLDLVAEVDAPAARSAAEDRAVAALEAPLGVVRRAGRRGEEGERSGALPVVAIGEEHRRAFTHQLRRAGADHLFEMAVAALDDAIAHECDADGRVVEDQLLLGERALNALLGFALLRDVFPQPDRTLRGVARLH